MIRASQRPSPPRTPSAMTPAPCRRSRQGALGDQGAHTSPETAQTDLAVAQGTRGVAARGHTRLHALDQGLVLEAHAAVDAPVEVARGTHLAARIRMYISDF